MRYLHMYVVGRSSERGSASAAGTSICLNAIPVNSRPKFIGISTLAHTLRRIYAAGLHLHSLLNHQTGTGK